MMSQTLMLLTADNADDIRLVQVPDDYEKHEAYRHVTGLITAVEEENPDYDWADIETVLEDNGFVAVDFIQGPSLD